MNILWIDNESNWLGSIADQFEESGMVIKTLDEDELLQKPDDIGIAIFEEYAAVDLFVINVNLILPSLKRIDNAGIKLLKLIRLHNLRQHCIMYSFLSREQLMQLSSENLILFSPGVTFHRLPDDFLVLPLRGLAQKKSPDSIAKYLKAEFNLPDERHMLANWWGVLQLWKVHCAVKNQETIFEVEFADKHLKRSFSEMNSFQGLLARYLFRDKENDIEDQLKQLLQKQEDAVGANNVEIEEVYDLLNEQIDLSEKKKYQLKILEDAFLDEYGNSAASKVLEELGVLTKPIEGMMSELNNQLVVSSGVIRKLEEYNELEYLIQRERNQLEQDIIRKEEDIQNYALQLERKKGFITFNFSLEESREKLKNLRPGIIYVDDQAEEGWAYVLQEIIYDRESEQFFTIVPQENDSIEAITSEILKKYNETDISLIILDLRLKGEFGYANSIDSISGFNVMKLLRRQQINCPILIFSASNKLWSFTEAFKYGASAYWMKEGIEDKNDTERSVRNYLQLVDLITALCLSPQYGFLREFKKKLHDLQDDIDGFWWEDLTWVNPNAQYKKSRVTVTKKKVSKIIKDAIYTLESFLHDKLLKKTTFETDNHIPSIVILQLARVLEVIHKADYDIDENNRKISLATRIVDQIPGLKNKSGFILVNLRNLAVHEMNRSIVELQLFVNQLFDYLNDYKFLEKRLSKQTEITNQIITPSEPKDGAKYISVILKKVETKHTFFYLKNPDLVLEREYIIMDMRWNKQLDDEDLKIGDQIEFVLMIDRKPAAVNYFASEAQKII